MYFKRLEMQGFKSFVEPVIIDFNSGVTCVVGPNGSGKSNLSDAIRWVLGEQSAKSIRASKMEDIIFSGTATRKPRGMAEVTLVIDNEEGSLPIDYSEVSITRRLYRSGESEYLINNNPVRLKDIKELIMDTGIGVDGYSIISQGKITELVESKPEARREVFEEAAGVVMYKSKKQESERKLESTENNLDRVNDIISEIEGRIDTLKEDSIKAKEYVELRDKRKDLEINITLRNVEKFSESNETGERDVRELTNRIENYKFEKSQIDISIDEKRDRFDNIDRLGNEARDNLLLTVEKINEITSKSKVDNEKLASLEKDENRLNTEIINLREKLDIELQKSNDKEEEKQGISTRIEEADNALQDAISIYNEKTAKNIELLESIQNSKNDIMELSKNAMERRADAKSYEQYKESLVSQKDRILLETNESLSNEKEIANTLNELNNSLFDNEEKLRLNNNNQEDKRKDQNKVISDLKDTKLKLEDTKLNIGRIQSRKKTIEEMESNYEGYNNAVRFLMKQGISGVHGVVAELINVPSGYEVAIETALGQMLQNIVCEKDSDAKKSINLLKENAAGRLTFLPIESVNGNIFSVNDAIKKSRGYLGFASDLIKFDKKYQGIINYLLGRTIIVSDMDTAIALSKIENRGIKYVTLDGEVINTSGAITGGKYKNQSANLLSRKNEINELNNEIIELNKKVAIFEKEILNLENLDSTLTNDLVKLIEENNNLQIEIANINTRINSINDAKKDSLDAEEKRKRDLDNIESDFTNATNMIDKALKEANAFEQMIKGIEAEITLTGVEVESSKLDIEEANELVTQKRIAKNTIEKEEENIDSLLQVILDNIDNLTLEIENKEDELLKVKDTKDSMLFSSSDQSNDISSLRDEKDRLDSYIKEVDSEKDKITIELNDLIKKQTTINDDLNDIIQKKQDYEIKLAKNETQLDVLKQRLLEDYEITYQQALLYKRDDFVYSTSVKDLREIRIRMDELGDVNIGSIQEYEQVSERYNFLLSQREDILKAKNELEEIISNIDKTIKVKFKDNFDKVAVNFESTFKELFGGGEAELTLIDDNNPLESGIDINVQPPGKKIQNIDAFSGGEKTMIGLALMMAVLKTKPTPFCILDEVEAALDDANIDKFAGSLKGFLNTQFAVITHQKATMEHADVLYGVTMPERGISKVLSLRLGDDFDLGDN